MKEKKVLVCNICNLPGEVRYKEEDDSGKIVWKTHKVRCLGHQVHPALWNMSPEYDKYAKFRARNRRINEE